jgi:hypothetical protein
MKKLVWLGCGFLALSTACSEVVEQSSSGSSQQGVGVGAKPSAGQSPKALEKVRADWKKQEAVVEDLEVAAQFCKGSSHTTSSNGFNDGCEYSLKALKIASEKLEALETEFYQASSAELNGAYTGRRIKGCYKVTAGVGVIFNNKYLEKHLLPRNRVQGETFGVGAPSLFYAHAFRGDLIHATVKSGSFRDAEGWIDASGLSAEKIVKCP